VCLDGEFAGKYDLTDKLFATVFIGKEISRIEIVFSEDDFVREIQVFGPGKFPDGSTKKCKQFSTMNKYLPGGGECIPFVIRDGVTTDMRFDSERTEYNTVLEPYVCFKSASIFHLGKETDVGYRFRPGLSGIHKMILFVRPYLFDGETFDKSYSIKLVKNGKIVRDYSSDFNVVQGVICEEETEFGADDVIEVVFPRVDDNSCCQIDSQIYIL
ncbi:MAG: hypothetical protein ACI4S9_06320, partial [Christensenellales bacterium]